MTLISEKKNKTEKVNIIIVNYNCSRETIACVNSILKSTYSNYRIFIVDNNSTDNSINNILNWRKDITIVDSCNLQYKDEFKSNIIVVRHSHNNGFASGNNVVIRFLINQKQEEFIWLLNPDIIIEEEVMKHNITLCNIGAKSIVGNLIVRHDNRKIFCFGGFQINKFRHGVKEVLKETDLHKLDVIHGSSLFTTISTFKELGLLPEKYFMYWEETEFCTIAKKREYRFMVNSKSIILNYCGSSSNSDFLREYLYLLNGLRFYLKFYPIHFPIIFMSTILKLVKALLLNNRIKLKAIFIAHIDFIKLIINKHVDIKSRIKNEKKNFN